MLGEVCPILGFFKHSEVATFHSLGSLFVTMKHKSQCISRNYLTPIIVIFTAISASAFDIYAAVCKERQGRRTGLGNVAAKVELFKNVFSRACVHVHFIGVWYVPTIMMYSIYLKCWYHRDTVSSVASTDQGLHLSTSGVCLFRQALALDERRVKFLPEYAHGGISLSQAGCNDADSDDLSMPPVKEVWFAGNHSDMSVRNTSFAHALSLIYLLASSGGRNTAQSDVNIFRMPLWWMKHEAMMAGLSFKTEGLQWSWDWGKLPVNVSTKFPNGCCWNICQCSN